MGEYPEKYLFGKIKSLHKTKPRETGNGGGWLPCVRRGSLGYGCGLPYHPSSPAAVTAAATAIVTARY